MICICTFIFIRMRVSGKAGCVYAHNDLHIALVLATSELSNSFTNIVIANISYITIIITTIRMFIIVIINVFTCGRPSK